jgi:hypothetical protein
LWFAVEKELHHCGGDCYSMLLSYYHYAVDVILTFLEFPREILHCSINNLLSLTIKGTEISDRIEE